MFEFRIWAETTTTTTTTEKMADRVGKTFVVTGGASGLGKATVELLFAQGANVAILDRDVEKGKALSSDLGPRAAFFEMDATKEETIKVAIDSAYEKFGRLDGAICCAGVGAAATTINRKGVHASGIFDFVLKVNVYGVFNTCKYTAEKMAKNEPDANGLRGILINCSSVAGFEGQKGQVAYGASKGALNSMTLPMARGLHFFFLIFRE